MMESTPRIALTPGNPKHVVSPFLYSQFAEHLGRCIYEGLWVGEDSEIPNEGGIRLDTVQALKKIELPALRWPGGCFADNYHWKDGIGPRNRRPKRYNIWWNQPESNQFGTDEFIRTCRAIGTEPYICLNVGSGTVEEASSWVEYCNSSAPTDIVEMRIRNGNPEPFSVKFWGIGNENWGCGGNLRPENYADLYRRFATFVRKAAGGGAKLIACGSHNGIPQWDERFLESLKDFGKLHLVDYLAIHIYNPGGTEINYSDSEFYDTLDFVEEVRKTLSRAIDLTRSLGPEGHRIGVILDEWGIWCKEATVSNGLYQQNTMRDALYAALCFHCFHSLGENLYMTNMAQTINVLQALILTNGPQMIVTPTYHVYGLFRPHRNGKFLETSIESTGQNEAESKPPERFSVSATLSEDGKEVFVTVINHHLEETVKSSLKLDSDREWRITEIQRLGSGNVREHNTFENPGAVEPVRVLDKPASITEEIEFPPGSITTIRLAAV